MPQNKYAALLSPTHDDLLSILVFLCILALWTSALVAAVLSRRAHRHRAEAQRSATGTIEEFEARLFSTADKFAESAPALLIMVGLLGTFVGIAAAIGDAQAVLHSQGSGPAVAVKLGDMMGGIGLKFRSSAWGLIGFLTLRPIISVLVTRDRRTTAAMCEQRAHKRIQEAKAKEEREKASVEAGRWKSLQSQVDAISANTKVLDRWGEVLTQLSAMSNSVATSAEAMSTASKELQTTIQAIKDSVSSALTASATKIDGAVQASSQQIKTALENSGRSVGTAITELSIKVEGAIEKSLKLTTDALNENSTATGAALKKLDDSFSTIKTTLTTSIDGSTAALREAMTAIATHGDKQMKSLTVANDAAFKMLKEAQSASTASLKEALTGTSTTLASMIGAVSDLTKISSMIESSSSESLIINNQLKCSVDRLNNSLTKITGDMEKTSLDLRNLVAATRNLPQNRDPGLPRG